MGPLRNMRRKTVSRFSICTKLSAKEAKAAFASFKPTLTGIGKREKVFRHMFRREPLRSKNHFSVFSSIEIQQEVYVTMNVHSCYLACMLSCVVPSTSLRLRSLLSTVCVPRLPGVQHFTPRNSILRPSYSATILCIAPFSFY